MKRRWVKLENEEQVKATPGFIPVEMYGSVVPEKNEIGAIVRCAYPDRTRYVDGLFESDVIFEERIFRL